MMEVRSTEMTKLIGNAQEGGYNFIFESKDELVFFKCNPPLLSDNGYFAGAALTSWAARQIITHGLSYELPVFFKDE